MPAGAGATLRTAPGVRPVTSAEISRPPNPYRASVYCLSIYLVLAAITFTLILRATGGHFIYALDDTYIHLELSRNIARGTYGINAHEFTTPSSSILWPFLLVPAAGTSLHVWLPLILNLVFGSLAALLLGRVVDTWPWKNEVKLLRAKQFLACIPLVVAANLAGLTFIGMEHTLQVLLAIGCAYGILNAFHDRPIPTWCLACAILGPSVRYESVGITVAVVIALAVQRRWKAAAITALLTLVGPLIFAAFLMAHGRPALPNSVLVKATLATQPGGTSIHLFSNLVYNLRQARFHVSFNVLLLVLGFLAAKARRGRAVILWGAFLTLLGQALVGRFGWLNRYEDYAVIFGTCIVFGVFAELTAQRYLPSRTALLIVGLVLASLALSMDYIEYVHYLPAYAVASALCIAIGAFVRPQVRWAFIAPALVVFAWPYLLGTPQIPGASLDIYRQPYQVGRFLKNCYRQSVAVSDLGLTSYQHTPGTYVLDVVGLGSNEALEKGPNDADRLATITHRHQIGLAVVFPDIVSVPKAWRLAGVLKDTGTRVIAPHDSISFYVTPDGDFAKIQSELRQFAETLPPSTELQLSATVSE